MAEAPVGGSQPGPRESAFAESCLDALSGIEELTHQNVRFARIGSRARGDAGPIRQNRSLRQCGGAKRGVRFAVVRMHRGAHSRLVPCVVKHEFQDFHSVMRSARTAWSLMVTANPAAGPEPASNW